MSSMEGVEKEKNIAVPAELCRSCAEAQHQELEGQQDAQGLTLPRRQALRRALLHTG